MRITYDTLIIYFGVSMVGQSNMNITPTYVETQNLIYMILEFKWEWLSTRTTRSVENVEYIKEMTHTPILLKF